ncbi:hypothetical protein J4573_07815 [Actinomadura barringtoniae]|uniref:Uncharacterized protein n=1 Tax=Actinomadura barringtoniae TaxID=1427535 RepID=A0A939T5E0_9ACTN|nr:hypothetical protein [Actinomadura barringtoniae]MBO2446992.1 hypothetical protein [Actinomadura barringtoniae]
MSSGVLVGAAVVPSFFDGTAVPATRTGAETAATVTTEALPTWQVDGVVWSMATVGNTVYATGSFTKARPPGTSPGDAKEVARGNVLAFDITTGNLITSFNHTLNAQGRRIVASPDGKRVYVGGDFTAVDGKEHKRIAAFDTATGKLVDGFAPQASARVSGIAATDSTVYFGGNFFNVNGKSRTRLAAVKASNGANLDAWKPTVDDEVMALAVAPGDKRVIIGGKFQHLNGENKVGVGAVDATSAAMAAWTSRPVPTRLDPKSAMSYVTDLRVQGDTVFGAADGEGYHWYDGRFAAKAENGDLVWLDNCYGATYGIFPQGQSVYSVSHAHDCSSLGAFGETVPTTWHRALAETANATGTDHALPGSNSNYHGQPVPSLLPWEPKLGVGSFTKQYQAAWAVTGNAKYVALGGEFPSVNGKKQTGLTRFGFPPPPKPVVVASDTFGRSVKSGFGSATTGGAWTDAGAKGATSVSGGAGKVKLAKKGYNAGAYLTGVKSQNTELTFKLSTDKAGSGSGIAVWGVGRNVRGAGDYRARVRLAGNQVYLQLSRSDNKNVESVVVKEQAVKGLTYKPGQGLRLKLQVTGSSPTTLRAKVWADGKAEPAAWQLSGTDTTPGLQAAGGLGVRAYLGRTSAAPATISVDGVYAVQPR